ncbi:MAG TPA: LapD/MoxY N-terminal periplasmic domain-containing protein [Chromatiaceae bacterium]|nr:LapD/MoxY N-terminal periplasmic domain-containing protein [Chromatiaceae bacterium]
MSLSKQLMLLISLLFLLIFGGNLAVGVNQMRDYLLVESRVHAQDTATSLGLSLSPHLADPDDPILETMIRAIYDMGYYQEIKLTDIEGRTLVQLDDSRVFEQVPTWFIRLLPMETATATSEISSGWNLSGVISVTSNPGYAYLRLYEQVGRALSYSLLILALSLLLLFLVLRLTLQPLKKIASLARDIALGHFSRIEPLPWTREVLHVARSMNFMAGKIEGVIGNMNQKLEALNQRLLRDEVTGLYNQGCFVTDLDHLFEASGQGYCCLLRIDDFAELARNRGTAATDRLLKDFGAALVAMATRQAPTARAYRFYGAEFALLMPGLAAEAVTAFAETLRQGLTWLGERNGKPDMVHIGIAPFNPQGTPEELLAVAQEAYAQARLIGINSYFIARDLAPGKTYEEWREIVFAVIDQDRYQVSYIGPVQACRAGRGILMEEAFTQALDEAGKPLPIGPFVSMAEKFGRIVDLDRGVILKVAARLRQESLTQGIAINLSLPTLRQVTFRTWLGDFLRQHADLAGRLVFSIAAYSAAKDVALFRDFITFAHRQGAKVLLKRYDVQFIPIDTLKTLKPDYLRLVRDLTNGIGRDGCKRLWVETMKEAGDLLEIAILAEDVRDDGDFAVIQELGLAGASR